MIQSCRPGTERQFPTPARCKGHDQTRFSPDSVANAPIVIWGRSTQLALRKASALFRPKGECFVDGRRARDLPPLPAEGAGRL
jgi:hypothetical protein